MQRDRATPQGPYGSRYPDRSSDGRSDRYDDYRRTPEYRRIASDAADYARRVDDALRIGNSQERRIQALLADRTARLLQRTRTRDHRGVYPFPRRFSGESRAVRAFWAQADRDVEQALGRRDGAVYRQYVRSGGRVDTRGYRDGSSRDGQPRGSGSWGRDDGERGSDRDRRPDDRRRDDRDDRRDD